MKIIQEFFGPETNVVSLSPRGDAFSEMRHGGKSVGYSVIGQEQCFKLNADRGFFSYVATRVHYTVDTKPQSEILFGNTTGNAVSRASPSGRGKDLKLFMAADVITVLRTSHDGRNIAVGNADGQFELWNMDFSEPARLYNFKFVTPMPLADICFSRSNRIVLIALASGSIYLLDLSRDTMSNLTREGCCPTYSMDTQRHDNGIIFGGDHGTLWTLNVKGGDSDEPIDIDEVPFALRHGETFTGVRVANLTAMPDATVGRIQSTVGGYVAKVRFLTDDLVCVAGELATEVWSLGGDLPQLVTRKTHDESWGPLSIGGTADLVRVALGRRF